MNIFAIKLRELMVENGLNISTLAEVTNIPRTTINNWLNQGRSPKIDAVQKLVKHFKVSADFLLGLEDELGNKLY